MKFSELWLRELIITSLSSEAIFNQISMGGLEVDCVKPVAGLFKGVVVGEVVECSKHPNYEKLQVTKVNFGGDRLLDIVCGAKNCRKGLKVAVATIGAMLPGNLEIKQTKLHGQISEGILCSVSELGIYYEEDHNKIIEVPADAPIGTDIRAYMKLDDNIIDINVTPNRADCLSIIGIARDIAVLNNTELNYPDIAKVAATISDTLPIKVEAADACPRYLGRVIKGINVKALTPLWMKEKLRRCGIRSIYANAAAVIIDVLKYVQLELGQPMHALDLDLIEGGIVVRLAKDNETLVLQDGREAKLSSDTLVIADYKKALAIAGIVGGENSVVSYNTDNLLLECAFFSQSYITGRASRYCLHHDAAHSYELGVDPELPYKSIERATRLLLDICGGESGPVIDVTNKATLPKRATIKLRRSKLDRLIGHHISDEQVSEILYRLGCEVTNEGKGQWKAVAPSWRFDIKIEEDLVEEIARVYGYNKIPNEPVLARLVMSSTREADLSLKRVKTILNDKGYQEVITYSFVDPKIQQLIHPGDEALILKNPISSEMSAMRLSLLPGLLGTIVYNQNRQQSRIRIFETGLRFVPDIQASLGISQELMLAGAICGNLYEDHWNLEKAAVNFYDIKGDLESILELTGKLSEIYFSAETIPALHPGKSAAIYLSCERIGFIGVVHPELQQKLDIKDCTLVFELNWKKIATHIHIIPQAKEISRFPVNRRDIAVVVADNVPAAHILAECKKVCSNKLVGVNLFDVYRGKGVADGYKSLAISLLLQDTRRTLKEDDITATVAKCVEALKERFKASLRN